MINFEHLKDHGMLPTDASYQIARRRDNRIDTDHLTILPHVQNTLELLCIEKGRLIVDLDGERQLYGVGDVAVVSPYTLHSCLLPSGSHSNGYYCVIINLSHFAAVLPEEERELAQLILQSKRRFRSVIREDEAQRLRELIAKHFSNYIKYSNLRLAASAVEITAELFENFVEPESEHDGKNIEFIRAVDEIIHESYALPLTTAELASRLSYSESYFCRLFKASFGMNFMSYLVKYRLLKAAEMKGQPKSINTIAAEVGFNDYSYFSRAFKAYFKRSPREYFESK